MKPQEGIPVDRVEAQAIEQAIQELASGGKRSGAMPVHLIRQSRGKWTGNNQLGVELPFLVDPSNPQTILKLDEWGMPEVWTISLTCRLPKELVAGQIFDLVGTINFGAGGLTQSFQVDWVNDTIFSLPMNAINILASWSELAFINGVPPPPGVQVGAIISPGSTTHGRATRTSLFGTLPNNQSVINPITNTFPPIPAFAKSATLTGSGVASTNTLYSAGTALIFLANNNTAVQTNIQTIPGNFLGPGVRVPIPANARYWTVANFSGGPIVAGPPPGNNAGAVIWNLFHE